MFSTQLLRFIFVFEELKEQGNTNQAEKSENIEKHASKIVKNVISFIAHRLKIQVIFIHLRKIEHIIINPISWQKIEVSNAGNNSIELSSILWECYVK